MGLPLSEVPCDSLWLKCEAGQYTVLVLNILLVDVSLDGIQTEKARKGLPLGKRGCAVLAEVESRLSACYSPSVRSHTLWSVPTGLRNQAQLDREEAEDFRATDSGILAMRFDASIH
ncbi:hypothetical protein Q8A73_015061 [Channa argus]|nr:hypothetical protein Q8A73_015061 [Channa argus]